jgi:hypothetical protein
MGSSPDAGRAPWRDAVGVRYRSSIAQDIDRMAKTAETGESPATPLLVIAAAWIISALAIVAVTAAVYLAIHVATS